MPGDLYRTLIDRLVHNVTDGQGQVGPKRARAGIWNEHATVTVLPEQHAINVLLARLDDAERDTVARMLEESYVAGVHDTLVTLHEERIVPFEDGYEGSPFHDFLGRLGGWEWPA